MKIKKVQISNFRAFNDVESSTFNFTNEENEISDLISIYAPNGFGKTSFYDAVEWGITGKIERFDLVGDFEKTKKENKKGGNKNILQHIGATENGFVYVITENATFGEKITNVEYNHKKSTKNKFFRDVVLSQEMIDNFLKEQTAEERYNKFVDSYPEVTKYNITYKNIVSLLNYMSQETKRLEKYKKENEIKQLTLDFDLEFKKFDQINEAIQFLITNQEEINLIDKENFNETIYDILTSKVKSRLVSLPFELDAKILRIENIQIARSGEGKNDNNGGIFNYIENKKKLEQVDIKIKETKSIISLIENKEKIQSETNSLKEKLSNEIDIKNKYLTIEKKIDTYFYLNNEITEHEKRISDFNKKNFIIENESISLSENNIGFQNLIAQLQDSLKQNQNLINELPTKIHTLESDKKRIESLQNDITETSDFIAIKQEKLEELRIKLSQLDYYENKLEEGLELLLELVEFSDQKEIIEQQIALKTKILNERRELFRIEERINSQNEFSSELKEYVAQGLNIISKNNSADCPLCNQSYKSFEELSSRIIANKNFDKQLKESLEKKINIEDKITKLNNEINLGNNNLKKHLDNLKHPFNIDRTNIEKELEVLRFKKEELNNEINIVQSNYNEALIFFNNDSDIDKFERISKEQIEKLRNHINELNIKINSNSSKLNANNTQLESNKQHIENLKKAINQIKSLNDYSEVIDFFQQTINSIEISKILFDDRKLKLEQTIDDLKSSVNEKQKHLEDLESKLSGYNLSKLDYINNLTELDRVKLLISRVYESYENFIRTEFKIELKDKSKEQIDTEFDKLIENEKSKQKIIERKIERYKIIEILKDDCLKATVSQKIQDDINEFSKKLEELKVAKTNLSEEKENLEVYLKKTIDNFFYTHLINAIYKKIEPHPDYTSIEFKCEFGESKPRLQIYIINKDKNGQEIKSVPVLYFSTAQINILSLSIFLARALKAKNHKTGESVDCIFIDDPIQSMDSINILSFIDLFRGIITSLGKQLIVSTHEENFHLLLQKKIPMKFYKSKFIEFETFGKLKQEA